MRSVVSLSLDPALKKQLDRVAKQSGIQKSDLMKEALRRYLIRKELDMLRDRAKPYARKAGYFTDEDVFKDL